MKEYNLVRVLSFLSAWLWLIFWTIDLWANNDFYNCEAELGFAIMMLCIIFIPFCYWIKKAIGDNK